MQTVGTISSQLGLASVISRACSFHPGKCDMWNLLSIPVDFDARLQTSAGMCHYHGGLRLTLNPCLQRPDLINDLIETFLHEFAHAMAHLVYGTKAHGHGECWQELMYQLGQRPTRCHKIAACRKATNFAELSLEQMEL